MANSGFWRALDELITASEIVIDRPKGSVHPRRAEVAYGLDYGYLAGTSSMDGGGIDVWRGTEPGGALVAVVVTVDLFKRDSEIKLLIGATDAEIAGIADFYNRYDDLRGLLVRRDGRASADRGFWDALDELVAGSALVVDRPRGSRHPRYPDLVYGVDYGYLDKTRSMDGGGIDVWRGTEPGGALGAVVVTVDAVKRDSEIKLLKGVAGDDLDWIMRFHNDSEFMKGLLIRRV